MKIPFEIPAKGTEELQCAVQTLLPGAFSAQLHVFVDDGILRPIEIAISGEAQ